MLYCRDNTEVEPDDQKQHRNGGGEIEQDWNGACNRWNAKGERVKNAHHYPHIREQGVEIGVGDIAEIFDQHGTGPNLASRQKFAVARADFERRLRGSEENDVVVNQDLVRLLAQAQPFGNLDCLMMMPTMKEADLAKVVDRGCDLDAHRLALPVRRFNIGM